MGRESPDRRIRLTNNRAPIARKRSSVEWVISRGTTGAREKHSLELHRFHHLLAPSIIARVSSMPRVELTCIQLASNRIERKNRSKNRSIRPTLSLILG